MIRPGHPKLSLSRQCRLLRVSRSSVYHRPKGESAKNLALMRRIDKLFLEYPFYGSLQMVRHLCREGIPVGRHRVRRLMPLMGLEGAAHHPAALRAPALPLSAQGIGHREAQSRVVRGTDVHPRAEGLPVPGGGHRLDRPPGALLEAVEHPRRTLLHGRPLRSPPALRPPRDLQLRPAQPIHQPGVQLRAQTRWYRHLHGRQGAGAWTTSSSSACGAHSCRRPSTSTRSPTASRLSA